jgi:hypothetical protein
MTAYLFRAIFGPSECGGQFAKSDNELLGVKERTEADFETFLKRLLVD